MTSENITKVTFFNFCGQIHISDKNQVELMPNTSKLEQIGHFQAISRVPENFWRFPEMMEF